MLGLVQVAGFSSKWEHRTTVEKHRIHFSCARTLSKPSNKDILMSLLGWDVYFDFGEIKLSVCANRKSYMRRPNGSLMCFAGCHPCPVLFPRQVIAPTLQRSTVLNDPGMTDLWKPLLRSPSSWNRLEPCVVGNENQTLAQWSVSRSIQEDITWCGCCNRLTS